MPGWRNGLRRGLKILDSKGFVGSNPTPGTKKSPNIFGDFFVELLKLHLHFFGFAFIDLRQTDF